MRLWREQTPQFGMYQSCLFFQVGSAHGLLFSTVTNPSGKCVPEVLVLASLVLCDPRFDAVVKCVSFHSPARVLIVVLWFKFYQWFQRPRLMLFVSSQDEHSLLLRGPVFSTDGGNGQINPVQDAHLRSPLQQTVRIANHLVQTFPNVLTQCVFVFIPIMYLSSVSKYSCCEPTREDCSIRQLHLH